MATFDDIKKTLDESIHIAKEGVLYAAERAEDLSRVAAVRLRIFGLRRRIEHLYAEIGAAVYKLRGSGKDVWATPEVKKALNKIAALEKEINELFAKLDSLSRRTARAEGKAKTQPESPGAPGGRRRRAKHE